MMIIMSDTTDDIRSAVVAVRHAFELLQPAATCIFLNAIHDSAGDQSINQSRAVVESPTLVVGHDLVVGRNVKPDFKVPCCKHAIL
jgi:hypothetical protein